jgi:gamma-glutamylcyclotransferase (GGCT)/AIG2-like uncharacterized protein YtfP
MNNSVFVYGTLKSGFGNHVFLKGSRFVCDAMTDKPYLFLEHGLPFVIDDSNDFKSVRVHGEVYEVNDETLKNIDRLEGHPEFYERKPVWVINKKTNIKLYVWIYFITDGFDDMSRYECVSDGIFKNKIRME